MIDQIPMTKCTGCQTCMEICPAKAISFSDASGSFLKPFLNKQLCFSCGACLRVCPAIVPAASYFPQEGYAAMGKDSNVIEASASGGAFAVMAQAVAARDGIVFGAVLTEDFHIQHESSEKVSITAMQGSKYAQSDMNHTMPEAAAFLKSGREVLFSGMPCQIAGLLSYLDQKQIPTDKLLTVDLICHGVPSASLFRRYKEHLEVKFHKQIAEIRFRNKQKYERGGFMMKIRFADGEVKWIFHSLDLYYRAFLRGYLYRESCYQCPYAQIRRVSDITIGDCNTYEDYRSIWPDKTISDIFINTEKGCSFWEKIKDAFEYTRLDLEKERHGNTQLHRPSKQPSDYGQVLADFQKGEYGNAEKAAGLSLSLKERLKMYIKSYVPWKLVERINAIKRIRKR